jgi:hypothetical protein
MRLCDGLRADHVGALDVLRLGHSGARSGERRSGKWHGDEEQECHSATGKHVLS